MRKLRNGLIPAIAAAALVAGYGIGTVGAADAPAAEGTSAGASSGPRGGFTQLVAANQKLVKTYLSRGDNFQGLTASTWTPTENAITINCPGSTGGCVVSAEISVQVSSANANIELCPYVDGVQNAQLGCGLNVGATPNTAFFGSYSFTHTFKVQHGSHTVRAFVLSTQNGTMNAFSNVYSVYRKIT